MRKTYTINGIEFKTKKALLAHIREIRDNAVDFEPLCEQDSFFMLDVLRMHDDANRKIGSGVFYIYVRPHPAYYQTRGFWIARTDNTHANFSFLRCVNSYTRLSRVKSVFRFEIDESVFEFKKRFFDSVDSPVCTISGDPLKFLDSHVHHSGDYTFEKIFNDFVSVYQANVDEIEILSSDTGRDRLKDRDLATWFVRFHDSKAQLQVVSSKAHAELKHSKITQKQHKESEK